MVVTFIPSVLKCHDFLPWSGTFYSHNGPFKPLSFYKLKLLVNLRQFFILILSIFPALCFPLSFWNCIIGYLCLHIVSNFFSLLFSMSFYEQHPHNNLQTFILTLFLFLLSYVSYPKSILDFSTLFFMVSCSFSIMQHLQSLYLYYKFKAFFKFYIVFFLLQVCFLLFFFFFFFFLGFDYSFKLEFSNTWFSLAANLGLRHRD